MKRLTLLLLLATTVGACSSSDPLTVTLSEFSVDAPSSLAAGATTLSISNQGVSSHTLVVSRSDGTVIASTPVLAPGASTSMGVDLEEGEYQFTCRIVVDVPDMGLVDHYAEGMEATVSVAG